MEREENGYGIRDDSLTDLVGWMKFMRSVFVWHEGAGNGKETRNKMETSFTHSVVTNYT